MLFIRGRFALNLNPMIERRQPEIRKVHPPFIAMPIGIPDDIFSLIPIILSEGLVQVFPELIIILHRFHPKIVMLELIDPFDP